MRVLTATLLSLLVLASPAAAAGDPLLSGYSGPGGGDQAILGSGSVSSGKGGGSLKAPAAPVPAPVNGAAGAPATRSGYPALTPSAQTPGDVQGARRPTARSGPERTEGKSPSATPVPVVSAPSEPQAASGGSSLQSRADRPSADASPLTFANVLWVVLGLVVLGATALATARLSGAEPAEPQSA